MAKFTIVLVTLFLRILFIANLGYSQERSIIVIIDTLVNKPENFFISSSPDSVKPIRIKSFPTNETHHSAYSYPHIVANIKLNYIIRNLIIPLDNSRGYILLLNALDLKSDTLHISKLVCKRNCLPLRSTYSATHWKIKKNGELVDTPFKKVFRVDTIAAECTEEISETITCTINGTSYTTSISRYAGNDGIVQTGHGYFPNKYIKKNGEYKKNAKYFHYKWVKTRDTYFTSIRLR